MARAKLKEVNPKQLELDFERVVETQSNLSKARVFTTREATAQHACRDTDVPYRKEYIDARTQITVDMQNV